MSGIVVHNAMVYPFGLIVAALTADIAGQTRRMLAKLDGLLERVGSAAGHILGSSRLSGEGGLDLQEEIG